MDFLEIMEFLRKYGIFMLCYVMLCSTDKYLKLYTLNNYKIIYIRKIRIK